MQPIDTSKLSAEISKSETEISKEISSKLASAIADKQRLAIGLLLKQTLQHLPESGLLSVDPQKAAHSAKNVLPGEFTQLYIQDRVQQHKLSETLANQLIKPTPLTIETTRQWFAGQMIQSIVYQATQNGIASLLVNESGQFNPKILSHAPLQPTSSQSSAPSQPTSSQSSAPSQPTSSQGSAQSLPTQAVQSLTNNLINNEIIKQSQVVKIKTELPLQVGQQLLLQINKNAEGISFQLNHPPRESHQVSQYINQFAVKQQALPQLLASLKEISTQTNQAKINFTPQFNQQVDKILQQFPQLSQISTEKEVKTTLQNSGQFFENKLLNSAVTGQTPLTDLKAGLSQLVALIKNNDAILLPKQLSAESSLYKTIAHGSIADPQAKLAPVFDLPGRMFHAQVQPPVPDANLFQLNNHLLLQTRILDQLEGVLSRIMVSQLQTREGGEQQLLSFEIPFRHNEQQEVLQLKIREELRDKEAQKGNKIWTVNLAFHLPSMGGIRIYITLDKQDLAIQFWTEEKTSQQLFQQYFPILSERLIEAGFTLSQLKAYHGIPESAQKEQKSSQFIIDEHV